MIGTHALVSAFTPSPKAAVPRMQQLFHPTEHSTKANAQGHRAKTHLGVLCAQPQNKEGNNQ